MAGYRREKQIFRTEKTRQERETRAEEKPPESCVVTLELLAETVVGFE